MSVPPPPQHPPPRRQPHTPEDPSLTTQIFIDQARAAAGRADVGQAPADAGDHTGADRDYRSPSAEDADTQALSPGDVAAARRRAAEGDGESTQMMSMEELRQLAASSRIEALDGPREGRSAAGHAPPAGAADEARAQEQAPPGVFSAHVQSHPAPSAPDVPPAAPHAAPPHVHPGYPASATYSVQSGHPAPPARPAMAPPAEGSGSAEEGQAEPPRRRRRMPVLAIAFVVLSALVVVGIGGWILVDAITRDGQQSQQAAPPPPATDDSTGEGGLVDESDDGTTAPSAADTESFATPSGNIGCTIDQERARCVVKSFDYSPPDAPDNCEMEEWGSIVVANRDGAGFSCTPADFPTDAETLDYGQTITAHGMICSSEETGVSCRSEETGAAFSVARADATFDQAE